MSAYQVNKRHAFLQRLIYVKEKEMTSYENMNTCVTTVTTCVLVFSHLEVIAITSTSSRFDNHSTLYQCLS